MAIEIRPIEPDDVDECARGVFNAFTGIADRHRFPRDFDSIETATRMIAARVDNPSVYGVVAISDGRIAGSSFLDERGPIRGLGPITVSPGMQGRGVGRRLMEAMLERGRAARGVRLVQDAFNMQSLALYASLGFAVREPLVVVAGVPASPPPAGIEVRPATESDLDQCESLHIGAHGFERTGDLRDAIAIPFLAPHVAVREGRVVAYASSLRPYQAAHGVADTEDDMRALILGAAAAGDEPIQILVPIRATGLLPWALSEGLRPVKPMNWMTLGEYRQPTGCWFPSVLY
jgi:predicted N-acetyltransferase YhbS